MTFLLTMAIHPAQGGLLIAEKMQILIKYLDFSDIFLKEKAFILPATTNLNQYAIKLQKSQQLFYRSIYSLGPIELKTLEIYIKLNLTNGFIRS